MGRLFKYQTVEALQAAIDAYFEDCKGHVLTDDEGDPVLYKGEVVIVDKHPPTVTGLAYALGFGGRQALLNYQARKPFKDAITRAKMRCEVYAEERLYDRDGARGAQFNLEHNFRWGQGDMQSAPPDDGLVRTLKDTAKTLFAAGDDSTMLPPEDDP